MRQRGRARTHRSVRRPSSRSEQGAVLVEASISLLFLMTIAAAILEYGALFGSTIDVSAAVRSAARAGSATTTQVVTDDKILEAVTMKSGGERSGISKVIIYKSTAGTTAPPPPCVEMYPPPAGHQCNVYRAEDLKLGKAALESLPAAQGWPASSRQPGIDYLGVWVEMKRTTVTTLIWSPNQFTDTFVMPIDPAAKPQLGSLTAGGLVTKTLDTGVTRNPGWNSSWTDCEPCGPTSPLSTAPAGASGSSS